MDVAFLSVKDRWKAMLKDMVLDAMKIDWMGLINPVEGQAMDALGALMQKKPGEQDMGVAKARLKGLLDQIAPNGEPPANAGAPFQWQGPREQGFAAAILRNMKPKPGELGSAFEKLFSAVGNDPLVTSVMGGIGGMLDRAKIKGGALAGMFENWFGSSDWEKSNQDAAKKQEPQLAGAMAAGSQEAFSTIFAAMLKRGKDPNVTATEKQTKELKTALKQLNLPNWMAMGALGL
jgi:hypothetical protein